MYITDEMRVFNVKDMYEQSLVDNKPLLSQYPGDWWAAYITNKAHFDRLFKKKYTSWFPIEQDYSDGVADITDDFRADVYAFLLANDKRFSELYRINVVNDESYDLLNNYNVTEEYHEASTRDVQFDKGAQSDSDEGFKAFGQQQIDDDKSKVYGSIQVDEDISRSFASRNDSNTKSTSAYNEAGFTPVDKEEIIQGAHIDTEDNTITHGSHTDTEDNTLVYGSHRDDHTNIHAEGARRDVTDEDGTKSYTMTKVGNIGVQTATDMLGKAADMWTMFDFYGLIFEEIAKNLLRGC